MTRSNSWFFFFFDGLKQDLVFVNLWLRQDLVSLNLWLKQDLVFLSFWLEQDLVFLSFWVEQDLVFVSLFASARSCVLETYCVLQFLTRARSCVYL